MLNEQHTATLWLPGMLPEQSGFRVTTFEMLTMVLTFIYGQDLSMWPWVIYPGSPEVDQTRLTSNISETQAEPRPIPVSLENAMVENAGK